jgi:hypothetical protein
MLLTNFANALLRSWSLQELALEKIVKEIGIQKLRAQINLVEEREKAADREMMGDLADHPF